MANTTKKQKADERKLASAYEEQQALGEQTSDYVKGFMNHSHIIEKYFTTFDLTCKKMMPFHLFPRQKELISAYKKNRHNIVTKPRQAGVTTTTAADLAVTAAYAPEDSPECIIIIANKFAAAKKFLNTIRNFLKQVPKWFWGDKYDYNKRSEGYIVGQGAKESITLVNGTTIIAVATSSDALRGYTPTIICIDEAAYIESFARELYNATAAATATGGKIIIISTPNGFDELYYKTYLGAINKQNGFTITNFKWYEDNRYNKDLQWTKKLEDGTLELIDEKVFIMESYQIMVDNGYKPTSGWFRDMCATLNNDKIAIARELDVKFEGSGGNVVEYEKIELQETFRLDPIEEREQEKCLWIWQKPIEGHKYIMGVDCSSGNGEDFSSLIVIDCETGEQAVELKGKIRPEDFAVIIREVGNEYKALTVVDTTGGYGDIVILELVRAEYEYLYYNKAAQDHLKLANNNQQVDKNKMIAGIKINNKRPQIVGKLTNYIENNGLIIRSIRFTEELKTFVYKNGRADHMDGFHDDIIFAAAIAIWVLETEYKNIEKAQEITKAILNVLSGESNNTNTPQQKTNQPTKSNVSIQNSVTTTQPKNIVKPQSLQTPQTNQVYYNKRNVIYGLNQNPNGMYDWVLGNPKPSPKK